MNTLRSKLMRLGGVAALLAAGPLLACAIILGMAVLWAGSSLIRLLTWPYRLIEAGVADILSGGVSSEQRKRSSGG